MRDRATKRAYSSMKSHPFSGRSNFTPTIRVKQRVECGTRYCKECGSGFTRRTGEKRESPRDFCERKTCSRECLKKSISGEKSHSYQGKTPYCRLCKVRIWSYKSKNKDKHYDRFCWNCYRNLQKEFWHRFVEEKLKNINP